MIDSDNNQFKNLSDDIEIVIKKYCSITKNIDILIESVHHLGIDSSDGHVRFRIIKQIPLLIVDTFLKDIVP